jgi:hypothetical protein
MSLTLSSTLSSNGVTLSWTSTLSNAISKLSVIYFDQTDVTSVIKTPLSAANLKEAVYDIPATSLVQGKSYLFSLQGLDSANNNIASNTATLSSPYAMAAPTLNSFIGTNNQIVFSVTNPTFAAGDTGLTGTGAKICFVFIDLPSASNPVVFEVYKPYGQTSYTLTSADNAGIMNHQVYDVAAYIIPDPADTNHTQSLLSNTIKAYASETPNAPTILDPYSSSLKANFGVQGYGSLPYWAITWNHPNDKDTWSLFNNVKVQANIYVRKATDVSYSAIPYATVDINSLTTPINTYKRGPLPLLSYQFTNLPVAQYYVKMTYSNDNGEGTFSNEVSWYNYTAPADPTNATCVIDPSANVANFSWTQPSSITNPNYPPVYAVLINEYDDANFNGQQTLENKTIPYSTSYSYAYSGALLGKFLQLELQFLNWDPKGLQYYPSGLVKSPLTKIYTKNTSALASANAAGGDNKITFSWSQPSVVDGNDRTGNKAQINITQGGMTQTIEGSGGSYVFPAVNGATYSAVLYDEALSPLGVTMISPVASSFSNVKPAGNPAALSNLVATPGDGQMTLSWSDVVGGQIDHFVYQNGSNSPISTTSNSVVITGLTNGQNYTFTAYAVNILGANGVSSSVSAFPVGTPTITDVVLGSSKTVTSNFHPAGYTLQSFEVVGLAAAPKITDTILIQSTPTDIFNYTANFNSAVLSSYSMSFAFPSTNSGNIATAIILLSAKNPNTGLVSTFYYNSLKP